MFGYVRPIEPELPQEERERFRAAYCGLCHALGRRCGVMARFVLNYDFTLLAILLSLGAPVCSQRRRCAAHPCAGCAAMARSAALDASAERSVILAWWQLRDHIADHGFFGGLKYRIAALFLRGAYRRARQAAPEFDAAVRLRLGELAELERERCASIDAAAEPFAALLAELAAVEPNGEKQRVLRQLFYHLGRWIYLIDAADDFSRDAKSGNYNPLRWRYGVEGDELPAEVKASLAATLDASIERMAAAYALLDAGEWTALLDSIFYESFYAIGRAVLEGVYHRPARAGRAGMGKGEMR